jgi:hypothetical protein
MFHHKEDALEWLKTFLADEADEADVPKKRLYKS